jgi:hypothetical protein
MYGGMGQPSRVGDEKERNVTVVVIIVYASSNASSSCGSRPFQQFELGGSKDITRVKYTIS